MSVRPTRNIRIPYGITSIRKGTNNRKEGGDFISLVKGGLSSPHNPLSSYLTQVFAYLASFFDG